MEKPTTTSKGPDLNLTFMFINHLNAGFQASYISLSFLRDMGSPSITDRHFTYPVSMLGKINGWIAALSSEKPLLSTQWTEPVTADAKEAFRGLETLKADLLNWQAELARILALKPHEATDEDLRILISQYARCTYAQGYFLRGLLFYGKALGAQETVESLSELAPSADADLKITHDLLNSFRGPVRGLDLPQKIFTLANDIPQRFSAHVHDINILISTFDNGFSYDRAGISADEAARWASRGFQPVAASYWRSNGFIAEEAEQWVKAEFTNAVAAREWRRMNIEPSAAYLWVAAKVPPAIARERTSRGESPPALITSIPSIEPATPVGQVMPAMYDMAGEELSVADIQDPTPATNTYSPSQSMQGFASSAFMGGIDEDEDDDTKGNFQQQREPVVKKGMGQIIGGKSKKTS